MNYFVSPTKTASVSQPINGIYAGKISKVLNSEVYVEVPSILNGFSFGPAIVANFNFLPQVNDIVICGFLNNSLDEIVVLGLAPSSLTAGTSTLVAELDDLTDTDLPSPSVGDVVYWDGSNWVNSPILNNAALTGTPTAPTQSTGDDSTSVATTEFVQNSLLLPIKNYDTSGFTVSSGDLGSFIRNTSVTANIQLPADSSQPIGAQIIYQKLGTGSHYFTATGGASIQSTPGTYLRTQYSVATAVKVSSTVWALFGDLI